MRLIISGDGFKVSNKTRRLLDEKLSSVEKKLPNFDEEVKTADVRIKKGSRWGMLMSFDMSLPKKKRVFAEVGGEDLLNMAVELAEEVERQVDKYRHELGISDKV